MDVVIDQDDIDPPALDFTKMMKQMNKDQAKIDPNHPLAGGVTSASFAYETSLQRTLRFQQERDQLNARLTQVEIQLQEAAASALKEAEDTLKTLKALTKKKT